MKIPNDLGGDWRIDKFVEYQEKVPPVQYGIFEQFNKEKSPDINDQMYLSFLMANTYQEVSALFLMEELPLGKNFSERYQTFLDNNLEKLIFGSAKKHIRYNDRFKNLMLDFHNVLGDKPGEAILDKLSFSQDPEERMHKFKEIFSNIKNVGRFSLDYIIEHIKLFEKFGSNAININEKVFFDYNDGSNQTSALFNLLYMDEMADRYDSGDISSSELQQYENQFDATLSKIQLKIKEKYSYDKDKEFFVTKLCSFRNLFKNGRYGGYHHDRQLGYIHKYIKEYPEKREFFEKFFEYRKNAFEEHLLGELNDWNDIRKERKRLWTEYGYTGVEIESRDVLFSKKKPKPEKIVLCNLNDF